MAQERSRPGHLRRCPEGYTAYFPNPLPPLYSTTPELSRQLSEADYLLGRLAGEGRRIPNPHLLIRPFIKREAVYSSRIEGTQATLGELLAAEAGAVINRSPDDLREVANYVTALEYGIKRLCDFPLSLRLMRELHEKLMRGVRGNAATPGEFRRSQNWIGPPGCLLKDATYVPPPSEEMMDCLGAWEKFLHDRSFPPLLQAGLLHYQFEAIHPFLDGNGRVGRLLIILFLVERGLLPAPLLYVSAFFETTRLEYYERLSAVTQNGDWTAWLYYFLKAVAVQAQDALSRAERINHLLQVWHKKIGLSASRAPSRLIDLLSENPYLTATHASKRLSMAFTTIQRALENLQRHGIVKRLGPAKRDRVYCAQALLKILEESPRTMRTQKTQ
jgi:Fic family protein